MCACVLEPVQQSARVVGNILKFYSAVLTFSRKSVHLLKVKLLLWEGSMTFTKADCFFQISTEVLMDNTVN